MVLENNNYSVFSINFDLVMAIHKRKKVINEVLSERLKEIFDNISKGYNITSQRWLHYEDYIHVSFSAHPNSEVSKFINAYKSASSRLVKKEFAEIGEIFDDQSFWAKSFFLVTTGELDSDTVTQYIESLNK